jgi:chaperonin GroES
MTLMPNGSLAELIEPMPGRVAVQIKTAEEITRGGLYLPVETVRSQHEKRATQGLVVAIGPDDDDDTLGDPPLRFKVGDIVVFGKYSGTEIEYQPPFDEEEINTIHRKARPPREKIILMGVRDILARVRSADEAANLKVRG